MTFSYLSVFTNNRPTRTISWERLPLEANTTYKVMIVGQPSWHLMDWNGCNFRRLALPKDLRKTFTDVEEAKAYCEKLEKQNDQDHKLTEYAASLGDGAWFDELWMV